MSSTTQPASVTISPSSRKSLVTTMAQELESQIEDGRLKPGDRLPSEAVLAVSAGVSRTVVREAVASLKAAGLIETRQGSGAFVLEAPKKQVFLGGIERATVEDILSVLELRLAVEVECAALAAARRTDDDIAALDRAIAAMSAADSFSDSGVSADLSFHHALARATGNPYFVEFLKYLGEFAVPRRHMVGRTRNLGDVQAYMTMVDAEHRAIRNAVAAQDSALAAAAMRGHLAGSRARYSTLIKADAAET
ncbi:FadR/GntR family transcriptional regulator [Bosea sp. BK604]|uniref:FadR/GntR family transcriptional regulator n=1 Tax=Bosea sp. BK604 TaxID=2512180 RepID=UPI0010CEBF4C|nr:FadR/GntR family transcriptional regulator [Bosea sp. BK604]TCR66385.1 GntR family transcriptional regulator [Bosea sp. BK604]